MSHKHERIRCQQCIVKTGIVKEGNLVPEQNIQVNIEEVIDIETFNFSVDSFCASTCPQRMDNEPHRPNDNSGEGVCKVFGKLRVLEGTIVWRDRRCYKSPKIELQK